MAKLILSMDGLVLKEIPLTKERTTIGRKQHNDIQIDNLAISGEHAVIVTLRDDSFLEDLNSTNGTYVNGQPIKKHFLQQGDVVELGKYKIKYVTEGQASAPADYDNVSPEPISARPSASGSPSASASAGSSTIYSNAVGTVRILSGSNSGKSLDLTKSLTTLGKPGLQVAIITRRPQGYFITHVEGAEFPTVNGQKLSAQARQLVHGDAIEIAGVKMEFQLKG